MLQRSLALIAGLLCFGTIPADPAPRIAIIIDDLGYELAAGHRTVNLPGPVACAVLPLTPRSREIANAAHTAGKEVLLHLPLQSDIDDIGEEPGMISLDTTREQLARIFAESFESVPFAIGVNNHRGSLLTQHPGHMAWLMEEIGARGELLFVDSYTTHRSVALRLARESGIPSVRRDVFLDDERDEASIAQEFERLKRLAKARGLAIGIGHPYPETLAYLERELPELRAQGFELVSIREYVALKDIAAAADTRAVAAGAGVESAN